MIRIEKLNKSYGVNHVLRNVDLTIKKGELVSLIGPSGCGKTTLLRCINRLNETSGGKIFVDDKDISQMNPVVIRRTMGYVIQQIGLFPHMTVRKNINVVPKLLRIHKSEEHKERINNLMRLVGLDPSVYLERFPGELSGGQQQRIGVIRGLAADPPILLMDEPFSALDPISREQLQNELLNIQNKMQKTIIFITHDMDEAIKMSDRIAFMYQGVVQQVASPQEMMENPANDFVKGFIGEERRSKNLGPAATLIVGDIAGNSANVMPGSATVKEAEECLAFSKQDSLVLRAKNGTLLGMVSAAQLAACEDKATQLKILSEKIPHLEHHLNIRMAYDRMSELSLFEMPVTKEGRVLGSVSYKSILRTVTKF